MKSRNLILSSLILTVLIGFAGCSSAETAKPNTNTVTVTEKPKTAEEKPKTAEEKPATDVTAKGDEIGVPECDEYVTKYEACLRSNVPEQARAMLENSLEQSRKSWKAAAANPQAKSALASACRQALETAKQATSAYACTW